MEIITQEMGRRLPHLQHLEILLPIPFSINYNLTFNSAPTQ